MTSFVIVDRIESDLGKYLNIFCKGKSEDSLSNALDCEFLCKYIFFIILFVLKFLHDYNIKIIHVLQNTT